MTTEEIQALAALLSKTPMTLAEQLWAQALINRLLAEATKDKPQ